MSDRKQNNDSDSEFDRDLALTSRAYKNAEADLPPPEMDDAIRAAARRAVKSQPHPVGKSWIVRYSAPLSAAALVMFTVSIGFIALDERPELAPATLSESIKPKVASSAPSSAPPAMPMSAPESPAPGVAQAPRLSQPAPVAEKKVRMESQSIARDQLAESPTLNLERRRNDDRVTASGVILQRESNVAVAVDHPVVTAAPAPTVKDAQTFVADATTSASAEKLKREAMQEKQLVSQLAAAARGEAAQSMTPKSLVAPGASRARPASVAPPMLTKAVEAPDVWIKRIIELKRQDKAREFEEELAKFRKRYPDYLLPEELKA